MKICSLFPTATEIIYSLGLIDNLVGITYACDYPPEVKSKPIIVRRLKYFDNLNPEEIDAYISKAAKEGETLYQVNLELLKELKPNLIITQGLCDVCSLPEIQAYKAVEETCKDAQILNLKTESFKDVLSSILLIGKATNRLKEAESLVHKIKAEVEEIYEKVKTLGKVKAFCLEWLNPPWASGHWVPEMVEYAGGYDELARKGEPSRRITWEEVRAYSPEVVILIPCGFSVEKTLKSLKGEVREKLKSLGSQIYATEASSYFNKAGPRLVDGIKILAEIFHKDVFEDIAPRGSYVKINL
ncbi:MAG: ABC transporter substrate-binding protein [Nitrososphaerales archaeon]